MRALVKGWMRYHPANAPKGARGIIRKAENGAFVAEVNRDGSRGGGRVRRAMSTITAARDWIDDQLCARAVGGVITSQLLPRQLRDALDAYSDMKAAGLNATLRDAVAFYAQHHKASATSWTVEECASMQLSRMESPSDGGSPARPRTISSKRNRLKGFLARHGSRKIVEITAAEVADWLKSTGARNLNLMHYRAELQSLFNFAQKNMPGGYQNTVAVFPKRSPKETPPAATLQPAHVSAILHQMEQANPRAALGFALGCFAGLRTEEITGVRGLEWQNIDFEAGTIFLPAAAAKGRVHRKIRITSNLMAWLLKYRGDKGKVSAPESEFYPARQQACRAVGITMPHNGARHSFATYYSELNGAFAAAEQIGHSRGIDIFKKHYEGQATRSQAEAFFAIRPGEPARIIAMPTTTA